MVRSMTDLPTVQDVLKGCNRVRLSRAILSGFALGEKNDVRVLRARKAIERAIQEMCKLDISPSSGIIVMPRENYEFMGEGIIVRSVLAMCVNTDGDGVFLRDLEVQPWEHILGFSAWMGCTLCLVDRYDYLADVCWSMLRAGLGADEARARFVLESSVFDDLDDMDWVRPQWDFREPDQFEEIYNAEMRDRVDFWNDEADEAFHEEVDILEEFLAVA